MLSSNALTLFNANYYDALFAALSHVIPQQWRKNSLKTKLTQQKKRLAKVKAKTKNINKRILKRTSRNIAAHVASIPAEAVPALGLTVIIGMTAMDIHDACQTLTDLNSLSEAFELETDKEETQQICGTEIPTIEDFK